MPQKPAEPNWLFSFQCFTCKTRIIATGYQQSTIMKDHKDGLHKKTEHHMAQDYGREVCCQEGTQF
jgi:hypothetical protein